MTFINLAGSTVDYKRYRLGQRDLLDRRGRVRVTVHDNLGEKHSWVGRITAVDHHDLSFVEDEGYTHEFPLDRVDAVETLSMILTTKKETPVSENTTQPEDDVVATCALCGVTKGLTDIIEKNGDWACKDEAACLNRRVAQNRLEDMRQQLAAGQVDMVNHPPHYTSHPSGVECITVTEHMGFNLGNAVKYIWRADLKGDATADLEKAAWYVNREIQRRKAMPVPPTSAWGTFDAVAKARKNADLLDAKAAVLVSAGFSKPDLIRQYRDQADALRDYANGLERVLSGPELEGLL